MGFLACLCRCPQDGDDDEKEGEQFRINHQVASGDGRCSCFKKNSFFLALCFLLLPSLVVASILRQFVWLGNSRFLVLRSDTSLFAVCVALILYSGTMLPVKLNSRLLSEGRLILQNENKTKSTDS